MNNALEIKGLNKEYKNKQFKLDHVSFSLPAGAIMGFVGENGAGKSTTIKCILNTIIKDKGSVKVFGEEMTDKSTKLRDDIGVVYDSNSFPVRFTPQQISKAMGFIYTKWDKELFASYLNKFKLPVDKPIKTFSRGMGMKFGVAVAMSHHPKLLILDEATSGLDPIVRDDILEVFQDFVQDENHSILLSSHITSDLEKIADYITFIHEGKIIYTGMKDTLTDDYGVMRLTSAQFEALEKDDIVTYRKHDYQIDVLVANRHMIEKKYKDAIIDHVSIEEIMLLLVKGAK